jgi:hypothetical protein
LGKSPVSEKFMADELLFCRLERTICHKKYSAEQGKGCSYKEKREE